MMVWVAFCGCVWLGFGGVRLVVAIDKEISLTLPVGLMVDEDEIGSEDDWTDAAMSPMETEKDWQIL